MGTSYNPKIVTDGLVLNLDPANVKSYPAGQDPFVNNVSLMLDGESLTDKSQNSVAVTVQGAVTVDSSIKRIGNSSLKFAGAKTDYLTISSSSLFNFPGDFTIEFWTYANQFGQQSGFTTYFSNDTLDRFQLALSTNANIQLYLNGSLFIQGSLSASAVGRWMHIALVRSGTTVTIYENGVSRASGTSSYSVATTLLYIGRQLPRSPTDFAGNLDGYIDDFRITKGARYTANFTPPTAPLSLPGVVTDLTQGKNNQTLIGGPTYSGSNGGIMTFNGTSAYAIGARPASLVNGGQITIALWAKWTTVGTTISTIQVLIENNHNTGTGFVIQDRPDLAKKLSFFIGRNSTGLQSTGIVGDGLWHHIVFTNNGTISSLYVDGIFNNTLS
jgi:hypothetical protein